MPYLVLILFFYTLSPIVGLFGIHYNFYSHPYSLDSDMFVLRVSLTAVFLVVCLYFSRFRFDNNTINIDKVYGSRKISIWLVLVVILALFVFFTIGVRTIGGDDRGSIRVSLGVLGPLIRLTMGFLLPLILSILMIRVIKCKGRYTWYEFLVIVGSLIVIGFGVAFLSGYKASFIYITGPFITVLLMKRSWFPLILFLLFGAAFLVLMTVYVRGIPIGHAIVFLIRRSTFMTAYGDQCFGALYAQIPRVDLGYALYNFMGNISKLFVDTNFLYDSLNVSTSLLCYPDKGIVISGRSNLTVTGFSELIHMFGWWSFIPVILLGRVIGFLLCQINKGFYFDSELLLSIKLVLFFSVILTWLNSGSLFSLFSLFNFVYLAMSVLAYGLVKVLIKR